MKNMFKILSTAFFLFFSSFSPPISPQDRGAVREFFRYFVYDTPAPFTLFGDKPISIIACSIETHPLYVSDSAIYYALRKNFSIWKRYLPLFCSENYAMIENDTQNPGRFCVLFINKRACLEVINSHLPLFQEILEEKLSAENILAQIEHSSDLFETLHHHRGLLGLLLGFGKNNAWAFRDLYEKQIPLKPLSLFNENSGEPLFLFHTLNFAVIKDDPETLLLKQKYAEQRKHLIEIYQSGDFLDITLAKLNAKPPLTGSHYTQKH